MAPSAPPAQELAQHLGFARDLAREAGRISLKYYRKALQVEAKADQSPVTVADRETEQFVRERIADRFPSHGILGEEFGEVNAGASWRWIIDPIDGTQAFIHGVPLYTLLIGLEWEGDSHVGIIHNPPQDETVAAATGLGATYNGQPCRVSTRTELASARVHTTDYAELARRRPRMCAELLSATGFARTWADAYGYMMVATGRAEVMLDPIMSLWDVAALKPVILEAGGAFTDLDGNPTIHQPSALATNGALHAELLRMAALDRR